MTPRRWSAMVLASAGAICACRRERPKQEAAVQAGAAITPIRPDARSDRAAAESAYAHGAYDSARVIYIRLASRAQEAHDTLTQARALTQAGLASWRSGRYEDARTLGERALALKMAARLKNDLAKSYNALGLLAHDEGRFSEAIQAFDRAEAAGSEVHDSAVVAKARGNRGLVYSDIGDFGRARSGFSALRDFARSRGDIQLEGNALVNLGMLEIRAGSPATAMPLLTKALQLERTARFSAGEENALGQIGTAYQAMGEPQLAIAYLDSALLVARGQGLRQPETDDLQILAQYYVESGDYQRALELLAQAGSVADSLGMRNIQGDIARAEARALLGLGDIPGALRRAEAARRDHADAGATFEQMEDELAIAELARRKADTAALSSERAALASARRLARSIDSRVARVEVGLGEARVAALARDPRAVLQAIAKIRADLAASTTGEEWEASALESSAFLSLGQLEQAVRTGREAVRSVERVRGRLTAGPLRTSFTAERAAAYGNLVIALLRHADTADAFQVADAARSHALLEHLSVMRRDSQHRSSAGDLTEAEQLLRRIDQLVDLLRAADVSQRRSVGRDQTAFLSRQLAQSRRDYEAIMKRVSGADRGSVAIARGDTSHLSHLREALRGDEAILEYFATETRLLIFVVDRRRVHAIEVPVGDDALSSRIRLARELLGRPQSTAAERTPVLTGLYSLLIAPAVRAHWLDGIHTVAIVPHAALAYLPFASLVEPETGHYLVQSFDLFELPSGSSLAAVRAESIEAADALDVTAFAPFPTELPGTRAEADAVGRFTSQSRELVGGVATETALRAALRERGIVHVATHGVLNARAPMFSRIELARPAGTELTSADDGRLEVHEVLDLTIRSPLVFLSGCETGSGAAWSTSFMRGDDYTTLAEAFLYAGARNVISTLWRIEDRGAAAFASTFYGELRARNPTQALGAAQREMLSSPQYASPYYWSAYVASGDGRAIGAQNRSVSSVQ